MVCGCEIKLDRWCFCNAINPDVGEGLICGDFTKMIEEIAKMHINRGVRGLVITLPCQSMSLAGGQHLDDPLTWLFLFALELCKAIYRLSPEHLQWVFWENCPYFISDKQDPIITNRLDGKIILQTITKVMNSLDMDVNAKVLDASFYGTAQMCRRGIILCRKLKRWEFPKPDEKPLTCGEVIGDRNKFEMLDSSHRRSSTNEFHRIGYVSPVQEAFIRKIKSGMSAFQ
ncbi:MAG: DNA cytosine methyltransferase [Alphaproteobacteria bacterium]|nr:DNA cytosine methyltransferase [Alphaproteobacteria bacterium]